MWGKDDAGRFGEARVLPDQPYSYMAFYGGRWGEWGAKIGCFPTKMQTAMRYPATLDLIHRGDALLSFMLYSARIQNTADMRNKHPSNCTYWHETRLCLTG